MFTRQKVAALVAEALGTGVLVLLVLSVQRSTIGVPFFVALSAGLAVMLMVFAVGRASEAHFNPAITLGFWTARRISTVRAILYIAAQFLGAWLGYVLYTYFVNNSLQDVGGHYSGRILAAEAVGAGLFGFGFAAAVYQGYSRAVTASFVGLAYVLGIIAASSASLGLLNPALALGVKAWVPATYVLGPVLGAVIGINLYALLFTDNGLRDLRASVSGNRTTAVRPAKKKTKK
ncbi:MAG TPA: aquaporin [Candidatus Saccharimonadales bacterium]|nr:aquaporin [Candidatus Saccharimonadales bacterium]